MRGVRAASGRASAPGAAHVALAAPPMDQATFGFPGLIVSSTYLVAVDAMSKWMEVFNVSSTTANGLIDCLSELFSRWGIPRQIVSDNGPQFTSKLVESYIKYNGWIYLLHRTIRHPMV